MPEKTPKKEDVDTILRRFIEYKKSREVWRTNVSEDIKFNTPGGQWTDAQVKVLEARGQAPIEIPIIRPQIDLMKSQIISKSPQFKCIGRTDDDVKRAKLFSELVHYVWYVNDADIAVDRVVDNQFECGKGYFYAYWDPMKDEGFGQIMIEPLHPLDVVPDPESRRLDEEDSDRKFIYRYISIDRAKTLFPDHAATIDKAILEEQETKIDAGELSDEENVYIYDEIYDSEREHILYLEQQRKISIKYYVVEYNDQQGNMVRRELEVGEYAEFKKQLAEDADGRTIVANSEVKEQYRTRVERTLILGDKELYREVLPTEHYTIIPVPYEHKGNPYTVSLTRKLRGLQKEVNHRRSLMIAHATASTAAGMLYPEGAFEDIEEVEENWARPGGTMPYRPDPTLPNGGIIIKQPSPLPSALYELESKAKYDAQYTGGAFSISHGDTQNAPETFRATMMLDEFSGRRMSLPAKNLYYALRILGKIVVSFIQHYMTEPRIIRIVNPYDPQETQVQSISIGDSYAPDTVASIKDPSVGKFDIHVTVGSMAPSNRYAEMEMYEKMFQAGIIDDVEFMKKTDVVDREGVLQRKGEKQQMAQQIQQQAQQIDALGKELEETRDQLQNARITVQSTQADKLFDRRLQDMEFRLSKKELDLEAEIDKFKLLQQALRLNARNKQGGNGNAKGTGKEATRTGAKEGVR